MQKLNLFLTRMIKDFPVTSILILLNTIMLIVTLAQGGFTIGNLYYLGGLVPVAVTQNHEYYRIVTSMFLHGGIVHFLLNMYALYYLGRNLEYVIGTWKFTLVSVVGGLGASFAILLFTSDTSLTIGASGMIFAIVGALLVLTLTRKQWFRPQAIRQIQLLVVLNIVLTFTLNNISVSGHIGGLLVGFILMFFLAPDTPHFIEKRYRT